MLLLAVVGWRWRHCCQLCRRYRCWAAVATHTLFVGLFFFIFVCRVAARPRLPPQCRRRRLQDLVHLVRKHTKIHEGKRKVIEFLKTLVRKHSYIIFLSSPSSSIKHCRNSYISRKFPYLLFGDAVRCGCLALRYAGTHIPGTWYILYEVYIYIPGIIYTIYRKDG